MMRSLRQRSANTPPTMDKAMDGSKAIPVTRPNREGEPVASSSQSGNKKRIAALPNKEMIWPTHNKRNDLDESIVDFLS